MANDRNKPCPCGSGKKRKLCLCWQIEAAHEEALREDDFRRTYVGGRRRSNNLLMAVALAQIAMGK